jgi:hypothetical protein
VNGLSDRREDLRCVEDLRYLTLDVCQDVAEATSTLNGYVERRLELHGHVGLQTGDLAFPTLKYCIVLQCWPDIGHLESDRPAAVERYVPLEVQRGSRNCRQRSVLVIVRKIDKGHKRIVGGVPSVVFVAPLDPVDDGGIDAGETCCDPAIEPRFFCVGREVDPTLAPFAKRARRTLTASYQPPRHVVEGGPVVVDRIAEPCGEGVREIGPSSDHHELDFENGTDLKVALLAVWLDVEDWIGLTVEEPLRLAPGCTGMEVRPLKFDPRALEGISHAR